MNLAVLQHSKLHKDGILMEKWLMLKEVSIKLLLYSRIGVLEIALEWDQMCYCLELFLAMKIVPEFISDREVKFYHQVALLT